MTSAALPQQEAAAQNPLAPKPTHHPPKARHVIWLFMRGGPSQVDLFDYKPALEIVDGQPVPKRGNARYWKSAW